MPCYDVPFTDRFGTHIARKWANTPEEARELVKSAKSGHGIVPKIGKPVEVLPIPFSDEARAQQLRSATKDD